LTLIVFALESGFVIPRDPERNRKKMKCARLVRNSFGEIFHQKSPKDSRSSFVLHHSAKLTDDSSAIVRYIFTVSDV